jgi:phosphoribosylformylglycinamidine synthase subunit PurQ / glutaminase
MKFGVIVFPGSNCGEDCVYVLNDIIQQDVVKIWHQDTDLQRCDALVLPGGFSYGDYLRSGAIARFSPIMRAVGQFARDGGLIIGICNGFQILLEAGLLPGAMLRNTGLRFICKSVPLRIERTDSPFTHCFRRGEVVWMPIAHNEGRYTASQKLETTLNDHVVFRYSTPDGELLPEANPNGSTDFIAGITNQAGNVMGMMPHPERAAEPELGSEGGRWVFESMVEALCQA